MRYRNYDIDHFQSDHESEVLSLLTYLWGSNQELKRACLNWKYYQNPYAKRPLIYVALDQNDVIFVKGFVASEWKSGNGHQSHLCLIDADAVTHPNYRRRGILRNATVMVLEELEKEGYEFLFVLSGNEMSVTGALTEGWRKVINLEWMTWRDREPSTTFNSIKKIAKKIPFISKGYQFLKEYRNHSVMNQGRKPDPEYQEKSFESHYQNGAILRLSKIPRPAEMATLVNRCDTDKHIRHVRDEQYFSWKFRNPFSVYWFLYWYRQSLEGYLVLQRPSYITHYPVTIVDWEASELGILSELIQTVIINREFKNIRIWSSTLSEETKQLLLTLGFSHENTHLAEDPKVFQHAFLARPINLSNAADQWKFDGLDLMNIENWDLRPIFSDEF